MAIEKRKPIVLHIRGVFSTNAAKLVMRDVNVPKDWPIHMHCFTDTWQFCEEWAKEWTSMMFGFTPDSFSEQVIANLPLSRMLLETDAPYFLPIQVIILLIKSNWSYLRPSKSSQDPVVVHTSYNSFNKWTKISSLEITIF